MVLNAEASDGLIYLRKLQMQLASKMRFVSAQLLALLDGDLWLRNARHANAMAARLRSGLEAGIADGTIRGIEFTQPTQANAVFATLPPGVADRLREHSRFYDWDAPKRRGALGVQLRHTAGGRRRVRRGGRPAHGTASATAMTLS